MKNISSKFSIYIDYNEKTLAEILKKIFLREPRGAKTKLYAFMEISPATLTKWINNERIPNYGQVILISKYFGLDLGGLYKVIGGEVGKKYRRWECEKN